MQEAESANFPSSLYLGNTVSLASCVAKTWLNIGQTPETILDDLQAKFEQKLQ